MATRAVYSYCPRTGRKHSPTVISTSDGTDWTRGTEGTPMRNPSESGGKAGRANRNYAAAQRLHVKRAEAIDRGPRPMPRKVQALDSQGREYHGGNAAAAAKKADRKAAKRAKRAEARRLARLAAASITDWSK